MKSPGGYKENFRSLFSEIRQYLTLQKRYVSLDIADKLVVILSTIAIVCVCFTLVVLILFFLSMVFALWLGQLFENLVLGYLVIVLILVSALLIFYANRTRWIVQPLAKMMMNLFTETATSKDKTNEQKKESPDEYLFD